MARKTVFVGVPVLASVCHLACKSKSNNHFVFQDQDRFSNMAVHKGRICFILEDKSSSLLCYFRFFLDPFKLVFDPYQDLKIFDYCAKWFTVVHADDKATIVAKLRIQMVKTSHAKGFALSHNVSLASERPRTLCTSKMSQMPMSPLGLGAFIRQDEL